MVFLNWLEQMRTPALDAFFSAITRFGEESLFIIIGLILLWCVNKKHGYYLLMVGASGIVINQFLKMIFRIPRPWIRDAGFTIVEAARAEATGYSFPSGHTQIAVGMYGGMARVYNKKSVRIACILLAVLVAFSRMYLGVHTPWDVLVSAAIACALIFGIHRIFEKAFHEPLRMNIIYGIISAVTIAYILFVSLHTFPADVDLTNLQDAIANGYKMFGAVVGMWLAYNLDMKYIRYKTDAPWWGQIIKLVAGTLIVIIIKSVLKEPLLTLFNGHFCADSIRYFLMVFFAAGIWPITFKLYRKKK